MERKSLTASELGRRAKVSKQTLSNWLAGKTPRDLHQLKRVADVLGVTVDQLLYDARGSTKNTDIQSLIEEGQPIRGLFEVEIKMVKKA